MFERAAVEAMLVEPSGAEALLGPVDASAPSWSPPPTPTCAVCITLYNEDLEALRRTMTSVILSIAHRERAWLAGPDGICICIVVDGEDAAHPDVLRWLKQNGLVGGAEDPLGETLHYSSHDASELLGRLGREAALSCVAPIGVIVCMKAHNRGKLHSHAMFFQKLCERLQPEFCVQIDAGTVIAEPAYGELVARMRREPDIGALATCIMTTRPHEGAIFLSTWQYIDFVLQKSLHWPFETATGHLSVIPGQFCMFRWRALQRQEDPIASDEGARGPIDAYLRGLATTKPLEKVMYLAEDRVIGNEIVLSRGGANWRLVYAPEAHAVTDACETVGELMRQRRRWNNSALACRLWLLGKVPGFLVRPDRGAADKARFTFAMLCQALLLLFEFGAPAVTLAMARVLVGAFDAASGPVGQMMKGLLVIGLVAIVGLSHWRRRAAPGRWRPRLVAARECLGLAVAAATGWMLFTYLPPSSLLLMIVPSILIFLAMCLVHWNNIWRIVLLHQIYLMGNLIISPILTIYSVMNMHDVSWGTKGLTDKTTAGGLAGMRALRAWVIAVWLSLNGVLGFVALRVPGLTSPKLNLLFELTCAIGGVTAFVAVANLASRWLPRRRGRSVRLNAAPSVSWSK